jgi:hypothetical protein
MHIIEILLWQLNLVKPQLAGGLGTAHGPKRSQRPVGPGDACIKSANSMAAVQSGMGSPNHGMSVEQIHN